MLAEIYWIKPLSYRLARMRRPDEPRGHQDVKNRTHTGLLGSVFNPALNSRAKRDRSLKKDHNVYGASAV